MAELRAIEIRDDSIRLGQLLKLAGLVDSGSDVKALLLEGAIDVNGEPETRRGRALVPGDVVRCGDEAVRVAAG